MLGTQKKRDPARRRIHRFWRALSRPSVSWGFSPMWEALKGASIGGPRPWAWLLACLQLFVEPFFFLSLLRAAARRVPFLGGW